MATKKPSSANTLLRRYLSGALTAPEEAELERLAREDEVLAEAMRGLQSAPEEDHAARIRNLMKSVRTNERHTESASVRPGRFRWAAAAAILLLLSASVVFLPRILQQGDAGLAMETAIETDQAPLPPPATDAAAAPTTTAPPPPEQQVEMDVPPLPERQSVGTTTAAKKTAPAPTPSVAATAPGKPSTARTTTPLPQNVPQVVEEEIALAETTVTDNPAPSIPEPLEAKDEITPPTPAPPAAAARRSRQEPVAEGEVNSAGGDRPATVLDGRITNENGYPIFDALVRLPGLPLGERTDSNGLFQLPADVTTTALIVTHPDYEAENVDVNSFTEKLQISLERKPSQPVDDRPRWLQDAASSRIIFDHRPGYASPLEGYHALRKRIEDNRPAGLPAGKVKLSFLVHPDGTLSDFQFRGRPDQATMNYIGETLVKTSDWEVMRGEDPVRVYFKVVF